MVGIVLAIMLAGVIGGIIINRFNKIAETIVQQDPRQEPNIVPNNDNTMVTNAKTHAEPIALPDKINKPFTILLIGVDKRDDPEEGVRSDTLIVVYVNPKEQWASMLSIPRDSMVKIPGLGIRKVNYAYTYGFMQAKAIYSQNTPPDAAGGALAAETVEGFLNLPIDYIAQVDFDGFEQMIDMLGGIKIDVDKPILDAEYPTENFGFERIYIPAGLQIFDGHTALRYARSRHSSSDFDRSRRQQQVLRVLLQEVQQRGFLEQVDLLPRLVDNIQNNVSTTMPVGDLTVIRGLAHLAQTIQSENIIQLNITPQHVGIVQESGSDIYWNELDIATIVKQLQLGPAGIAKQTSIQVQNGTEQPGVATRLTTFLSSEGFQTVQPNDAPKVYEHTVIIDYTGKLEQTRKQLATLLAIEPRYIYAKPPQNAPPKPFNADIVVVVGKDYQEISP
jgi:LCP family protein required for cell wall assembly